MKVKISGVGNYIPKKVLTNHDLEKIVDTNDEWITSRTGIKERHIIADDETTATMAAEASKAAIKDSGLKNEDIDMVIVATLSPDMPFPATACLVQDLLGLEKVGTVDIEAACSGFIYALSQAYAYIKSGMYKNVLVTASETMTRITDWEDRATCVLFGDGAGAVVVSATDDNDQSEIIDFVLGGDGSYGDILALPGGGSLHPATHETVDQKLHFIKMKGNTTFKIAVRKMEGIVKELLEKYNIPKEKVSLVIPHQANIRITNAVRNRLGLTEDQMFSNIDKYGNTSSATIPIALREAVDQGRIKRGEYLVFVAFGGGLTWGASLLKF